MDKIDFTNASTVGSAALPGSKPGTKKTSAKGEVGRKTLFSRILEQAAPGAAELGPIRELAPSEEAFTKLMDAVHSTGSDLLDRPFPPEILRYKKAVRDFVHYVLENGFEVLEVKGIKQKMTLRGKAEWKEARYTQVRVIDQKLEEFAVSILSGQTDQLSRVSKLDEIRGLLVDLTITGVIKVTDDR